MRIYSKIKAGLLSSFVIALSVFCSCNTDEVSPEFGTLIFASEIDEWPEVYAMSTDHEDNVYQWVNFFSAAFNELEEYQINGNLLRPVVGEIGDKAIFIKTNSEGKALWYYEIGKTGEPYWPLKVTSDGQVFLCVSESTESSRLIKLDKDGKEILTTSIPLIVTDIEVTDEGNMLFIGSQGYGKENALYFYQPDGTLLWKVELEGTVSLLGLELADGKVLLSGEINTAAKFKNKEGELQETLSGSNYGFIASYNLSGQYLWSTRYSSANGAIKKIQLKFSEAGNIYSLITRGTSTSNGPLTLTKFRGDGQEVLWEKLYTRDDELCNYCGFGGVGFDVSSNESCYVGVYSYVFGGVGTNYGLIDKYDANGDQKWSQKISVSSSRGGELLYFNAFAMDANENLWVSGYFHSGQQQAFDPGFQVDLKMGNEVFSKKVISGRYFRWFGKFASN